MTKAPHHRGTYHRLSRALVATANADPDTRCWRCGHTIVEIRQRKPRAKWTAGHLVDGQAGGPMLPECSPCNYGAGQALAQQRMRQARTKRVSLRW